MNYGAENRASTENAHEPVMRPLTDATHDMACREPSLTISEAAAACGVERKEIERRQRQGDFPNAWRSDPEPGRSAFQSLWRIPVVDLQRAGLAVDASAFPHLVNAHDDETVERLESELHEWQQRALFAEAIAEERRQALEDARQALKMLTVAFEARNAAQAPPADAHAEDEAEEDEVEDPPALRLRGNWLR